MEHWHHIGPSLMEGHGIIEELLRLLFFNGVILRELHVVRTLPAREDIAGSAPKPPSTDFHNQLAGQLRSILGLLAQRNAMECPALFISIISPLGGRPSRVAA